ncbi:MAG: hypothetical protein KJ579_10620 [Verrucomicrobia bacterium]|nr:hypothetical protein [Verrucomicrobiota bacterium]
MHHSSVLPFALAGGALAVVAAVVLVVLFVQSFFLLWGARIAGIEGRSFGRALAVTILGGLASFAVSFVLVASGPVAPIVGFVAGFVVSALVAMPVFRTSFGRALGAVVLAWALSLLIFVVIALVFLGLGVSLAVLG